MKWFSSQRLRVAITAAFVSLAGGCANVMPSASDVDANLPVTKAVLPSVVQPYSSIEETLKCIARTGVIRGQTFIVGSFADSTGKINGVAAGSTGAFVPQGGSAAYITDAIKKAGGRAVSTYFGPPIEKVEARYAINGIFNSLDFGEPAAADIRVGGIGPTAAAGWAQLSLAIQLDYADSRLNRQISMIQRPVRYTQLGAGFGRDFGGTLVTGNITVQNQERLQLEAINGPIALGVADVIMKEYPRAKKTCGHLVEDLLQENSKRDKL
jgi:hypothetical protein